MTKKYSDIKREFESESKDANEAYEEYLLLLQQRNRLLKKLKKKDEKQLDLERKEQGFSLYLNGANVDLHLSGCHKSRKTKTAGDTDTRPLLNPESDFRVRTAPSNPARKKWSQSIPDKIKIKTNEGDKVQIDVPGVYSGKYEEDFEVYQSVLEELLDKEQNSDSDDDEKIEEDSSNSSSLSDFEDDIDASLTFTMQDAKFLRASLEKDSSIKRSIASVKESLSESESDSDEEEDDEGNNKNSTGFGLEEIEEEITDEFETSDKDISEEALDPETYVSEDEGENKGHSSTAKRAEDLRGSLEDINKKAMYELHGAAPKSRPVTATQRRKTDSESDTLNVNMSQDLLDAIAEENKRLEEYKGNRKTRTAPALQQNNSSDLPVVLRERPSTISNTMSDDVIQSITEKVRKLGGRQQRRLLKMLADLEAVDNDDKIINQWNDDKDKNKTFLEIEKNDRFFEENVNSDSQLETSSNTIEKPRKKASSKSKYSDKKEDQTCEDTKKEISSPSHVKEKDTEFEIGSYVNVRLELLSNWGHDNYIGLTEVDFVDDKNNIVHLKSNNVCMMTQHSSTDELKSLVNRKNKTVKEKYMWKCIFSKNDEPVKILFTLPFTDVTKLTKVILWNYNHSLQDLSIGVKECNIHVQDSLVWNGTIEKGCGNQVFDYSKVVRLRESEAISTISLVVDKEVIQRPGTTVLSRSGENTRNLPEVRVSYQTLFNDKFGDEDKKTVVKVLKHPIEYENIEKEVRQHNKPPSKSGKPSWLQDSVNKKGSHEEDNLESLRPHGRRSQITSPDTLEEPQKQRPSSGRRSQITSPDTSEQSKKQRPSSGRRSQITSPDQLEEPKKHRPSSGRRSQISTPDISDSVDNPKKELDDLFDLNVHTHQRYGRRSVTPNIEDKKNNLTVVSPPAGRRSPFMVNVQAKNNGAQSSDPKNSERQRFKEKMDFNLEQSLQSIDNFNFHHMGRITSNLDDDEELQSLLEPIRLQIYAAQQEDSINDVEDKTDGIVQKDTTGPNKSEKFELPTLPCGKELIINIKTTWGDRHYVGLNGVEVFSSDGNLVAIKKIQANPADINILPEYEGDPRVVTNLIDGCYLTRDDMHLWLTPYTRDGDHFVEMQFEREEQISMIRIWNYNKSRIHSTRGARFIEMALDGKLIFIGEIARASGVLSSEDPYGDTILFTMDEDILELVAANDFTYEVDSDEEEDILAMSCDVNQRPKTADTAEDLLERPFTAPKSREGSREFAAIAKSMTEVQDHRSPSPQCGYMECNVLTIFFSATWGDQHYLGLTGLEVLGETFEKIPLDLDMLEASPRDLNVLDEYDDDARTLDNLINDVNVTMSDENMWMIPFVKDDTHLLKITFPHSTIVTGLRVWNYNKSPEDTYRGAKIIHVYFDDTEVSPEDGFLVRKGPGNCHFDFAQDILFNSPDIVQPGSEYPESKRYRKINLHKIINEYETVIMPCGFVFQFKLFSTWGDPYYIGLNGIEVFDKHGEKLQLSDNNITAYPHSVNVLDGVDGDVRTPDRLIDGIYDTHDGRHMWLAPIFPGQVNNVYIVFDEPIAISMIKLWNYSKTPTRGVRQFGLLVDDLLVYSGVLPQCGLYSSGIIPGLELPVVHHTILFTDAEEVVLKERKYLLSSVISTQEQSVQLTNDRSVLKSHKDATSVRSTVDPANRPMTSVTLLGKPRR